MSMWLIVGIVLAIILTLVARRVLRRREGGPAWESLSREEQGIIARNSQPGTHGSHESAKALGSMSRFGEKSF